MKVTDSRTLQAILKSAEAFFPTEKSFLQKRAS